MWCQSTRCAAHPPPPCVLLFLTLCVLLLFLLLQEMARELSTGAFVVVELTGEDAVARFREVCGPRDVDVAKRIR